MATSDASGIAELVGRLLVPLCAASGALVLAGFFFPTLVGEAVTGPAWLTIALVFFSSGLCYIALLPFSEDQTERTAADVLLRVRQTDARQAVREFLTQHEPAILAFPVLVFVAFFGLQMTFPTRTTSAVNAAAATVLRTGGPLFLAAVFLSVCYCLVLLLGPWGDIKLGGPDTEPSYTYPTYFTLVFTAGIAAGLVFWGPTEALFHYDQPPPYVGATAQSPGAVTGALLYTLFHWGISAWSAYAVLGVPIAYFAFTRDAPLRVSTVLAPVLGVDGLDSRWATLVDTLAVFATIGGIATSVALVSEQFLAGINYQWDVAAGDLGPVLFVGGLTLIFVVSSVTGIHRGIRRIAGLNVVLFGLFALLIVAVGPRSFILRQGTQAVGTYLLEFVPLSLHTGGQWVAEWTVWNWSWWFSWAPFAGLFVAALSRGRRVRTVVFTTVVATSTATMVWFLLLGGTSLFVQQSGQADILAVIAQRGGSEAVAGFPLFASLPLGQLLMFLFLALIVVFITTSADTSTLVVSVLATRRGLAPSMPHIAFWGVFQGSVGVSVLLLGGAETLQALAVLTGGPFAVISLVAAGGLTVTWYRDEEGHTSVVRRVLDRFPHVQGHHDIDPPDEK
ncbi:BCCT family transporter [Haloarcula sp. S1AR25-5A]|uniref:BCCT family transporter n=1 Tax=Haloarcula terrestris TaxID=2950533 RepID=A0AAE4EYQ5_9EURY|nr:BCCT family transporter [Haloarcula terrestris]MDS0222372.1 BCCT family transporter [Haloarcula terrestris]